MFQKKEKEGEGGIHLYRVLHSTEALNIYEFRFIEPHSQITSFGIFLSGSCRDEQQPGWRVI